MRLGIREVVITKNNETALFFYLNVNPKFFLFVFLVPLIYELLDIAASQKSGVPTVILPCHGFQRLSNCISLYTYFYFPHWFLQKNGDIDLDKNENAFDGTMWSQAIWALKVIALVQSDLLRQGFVCACVCVCLLPMSAKGSFWKLGCVKGFPPWSVSFLPLSSLLPGLFILNSCSFVVIKTTVWDLLRFACMLCTYILYMCLWSLRRYQITDTESINKLLYVDMPVWANAFCSYPCPALF